jgi:hypothetical protein
MTTTTHSHKAWTDKGGHVTEIPTGRGCHLMQFLPEMTTGHYADGKVSGLTMFAMSCPDP